jgi:uncharacterized protein YecT (DUF1311 family)
MRKSLMTSCLILLAFSGSVQAEVSCDRSPLDMGNEERQTCSEQARDRADRDMRQAYGKALRSQKDRSLKAKLAASQRAWERYRELQCAYLLGTLGEATEGLAWYQGCMQDMAKERIEWLKK